MIDLLICEDKPIVLMGLKKITESLGLPLGEIFLAQDGEQAFELFAQRPISLVMTDIQMPGCNGLQLLRRMQQLRGGFQAIIISGHDDFEYAKTAIHLGIEDYLLKPVDPEELRAALTRCIDKLAQHQTQKQLISGILLDQLHEVWGRWLSPETEALLGSTENRFFQAAAFGAASFHLDAARSLDQVQQLLKARLLGRFSHFLMFPTFESSFFAIVGLEGPGAWQDLRALLEDFAQRYPGAGRLYCGIGPQVESIFHLKDAALQAEGALCLRFSAGKSRLVFAWENLGPAALKAKAQILQLCDNLCADLRLPEISAVESGVDRLFASFTSYPALYQTLPACLRRIEVFIQQELLDGAGPSFIHFSAWADTLPQLKSQLKRELLELCRARLKKRMATQDAVAQAIAYMEKNYQKPLTLTILANVVSLNYTYFSNIFKTKTGVSATAYLQNIRMQKAKELLISTNDRVREVAHKAGFTDERYFEKLFKRSEGITPSEYREKLRTFTDTPEEK
ncbi:response regulator [Acutalibacter intestini]|uniref:response regulator n=1 Tax=Acutalibacter intestini TaxID=3093659 RepID=UPI002AC8C96D|nr:response regulator [Acutalibacter sp. M00204]